MDLEKNRTYQIGFIICMVSVGLMILDNILDLGLVFSIIYGVMGLIGFIVLMKGFNESNNPNT